MTRGLSLYLDLLRFSLALVVFLGHASYQGYVGYPYIFSLLSTYAQTAVVGFFVLSGYVIAYVASDKEADPKMYAIARISRLYSVIVPALMLTAVLDWYGRLINPALYSSGPSPLPDHQTERYIATFFLIHRSVVFPTDMSPGTNGPFWSLGLEATYYVVFGLFLMRLKLLAAAASIIVLFLAGHITTRLFPCWLLGVVLYHLNKKILISEWVSAVIFLISLIAIARVGWLRHSMQFADSHQFSLRYVEAILFGVNIFAAASASPIIERNPGKLGSVIHWLGGMTFALYLCHRPLLQFLSSARLGLPGSILQQV
jgi:peptidoglycan/LPS O-acetylase OafA/YrhL